MYASGNRNMVGKLSKDTVDDEDDDDGGCALRQKPTSSDNVQGHVLIFAVPIPQTRSSRMTKTATNTIDARESGTNVF